MDYVELDILSNGMNGEGISKKDGKVYFVDGAIQGEKVNAEIIKNNKNFSIAKLDKIIVESKLRCTPKCKYFGDCGGCNLQHILYNQQLVIKKQNVQNLFNKHHINFDVLDCEKSQEYCYRNKLTLYLNKNNCLCFYKKNSKELVEINNCLLVNNDFNNLIKLINIFLKTNKEYNSFILKGITIRQINNNFIINLIVTKKINLLKLQNYLKLNKINYALYYCINDMKNSNIPMYPCIFSDGDSDIFIEEFGIKYPVYPMSFLQVNFDIKKIIYNKIISFVNGKNYVLDAYSGAGLLSAILAKHNKNVIAVEIDKSASKACEVLCEINNITNIKNICGDCKVELPNLFNKTSFDFVVLDPARSGVDRKILETIIESKVKNVAYLSCNPATLTRDLEILQNGGYRIDFAKPYDMFPQTSNVETLVILSYN